MQVDNLFYVVVDIDIKGFFDNVNHGKLLKQMWTLGIHDKKLLCIVSAMLKAEIKDVGIPEKGTPQGGILSPLLSNIVLNELDWWIASQWEELPPKHNKPFIRKDNGKVDKGPIFLAYRERSNLKECHLVRYADDFKIFCRKRNDADKIFEAIKLWLRMKRSGQYILPYIQEKYGHSQQIRYVYDTALAPIGAIKHRPPSMLRVAVNKYTPQGRASIHSRLETVNMAVLTFLMRNPVRGRTIEFNDNRLSLYCGQCGKCAISGENLEIGYLHCHHILPLQKGGTDKYANLVFLADRVHVLLHATREETLNVLLAELNLDKKQLAKLDKFRRLAEIPEII